ncbi:hypothetical protein [Sporosarcina sp. NPDC096371]|uniref:hypothetical protein n=1 Tax=Sporosarcina sp. NPDC096371 TaxID=3364530 RepID=UPI00382108D7
MGELERGVLIDVHGESFNTWKHADLIEGLLLHEKIGIATTKHSIGSTIVDLMGSVGEQTLLKLMDQQLLEFVIDDSVYRLSGIDRNGMKIGIPLLVGDPELGNEEKDVEQVIHEKVDPHLRSTISKYVDNHSQEVSVGNLQSGFYIGTIVNDLNNRVLFTLFIKKKNPRFELAQLPIYQVYQDGGGNLYVEVESVGQDVQQVFYSLLHLFTLDCLRAVCFTYVSTRTNATCLVGNRSTQDLLESKFIEMNVVNKQLARIIALDNLPDMATMVLNGYIDVDKAISLRKKSAPLRDFISNLDTVDPREMSSLYVDAIQDHGTTLDNKLLKRARFIVPTTVGLMEPASGVALGIVDYSLGCILENNQASVRLKDLIRIPVQNG